MNKNIPNILSILRIALIPVFLVLFFLPFQGLRFAAFGVFIIASLTDFLDGYIARKYKLTSEVGNFLDTIADKMLVCSVIVAIAVSLPLDYMLFAELMFIPEIFMVPIFVVVAICAIIIILRELLISGLKMLAKTKGISIKADKLGRAKMVIQIIALAFLVPYYDIVRLHSLVGNIFLYIGVILLIVAALITLAACINYLVKYRQVFKISNDDDKK